MILWIVTCNIYPKHQFPFYILNNQELEGIVDMYSDVFSYISVIINLLSYSICLSQLQLLIVRYYRNIFLDIISWKSTYYHQALTISLPWYCLDDLLSSRCNNKDISIFSFSWNYSLLLRIFCIFKRHSINSNKNMITFIW